jgi:hypothetical protein
VTGLFAAADRAGQRVTEFFSKLLGLQAPPTPNQANREKDKLSLNSKLIYFTRGAVCLIKCLKAAEAESSQD